MSVVEIVGGLKTEPVEIKPECPDDANVVEIRAEDIQGDIKKEVEENEEISSLENNNNTKIQHADIKRGYKYNGLDVTNITDKKKSANCDFNKESFEKERTEKEVQEKLILNDTSIEDVPKKKNNKKKTSKKNIDSHLYQKVDRKEYIKEHTKDSFQYRCTHCQFCTGGNKAIRKHIKQRHRDTIIYLCKEEQLKKISQAPKTSRYIGWYESTPERGNKYRCNHCLILIEGQDKVEKHIRENHRRDSIFQCPHCPYQSMHHLGTHIISMHTDSKDINYFKCDKCNYKTKLKGGLRRHIQHQHMDPYKVPEIMKKCHLCDRVFKKSDGLKKHLRHVHNPESVETFKCFHCDCEYKVKGSLVHHIQSRHKKSEEFETLKCEHCPFKTKFKPRMQAHFAFKHRRTLQCHKCSFQCSNKTTLDLHIISHEKTKDEKVLKYRCDKCDYRTYRLYNLHVHKLNHLKPEEIQYFYCYHCKFKAKRKDNLKMHIYRHYKQNEVPFQCYMCKFTTKKSDVLMCHIKEHSKDQKAMIKDIPPADKYTEGTK